MLLSIIQIIPPCLSFLKSKSFLLILTTYQKNKKKWKIFTSIISYGHVVSSFDKQFQKRFIKETLVNFARGPRLKQKKGRFLPQKKLALLFLLTNGQGECNVDKTPGNFPIIFQKPFSQTSEGDKKSFLQFNLKMFPWTRGMQILLLFRKVSLQKPDKFFPELLNWLKTEETSSGKDFPSECSCGLVDCSIDNTVGKLWPKKPKCFLSKSEIEKHFKSLFNLKMILPTCWTSFSSTLLK